MTGTLITTTQGMDGAAVVEIRGELDIACVERLRDELVDTVTRLRPSRLVVDLMHVTFVDSMGLGALLAGRNAAQALGIPFAVRRPTAFVVAQLRQTGLYEALPVE